MRGAGAREGARSREGGVTFATRLLAVILEPRAGLRGTSQTLERPAGSRALSLGRAPKGPASHQIYQVKPFLTTTVHILKYCNSHLLTSLLLTLLFTICGPYNSYPHFVSPLLKPPQWFFITQQ